MHTPKQRLRKSVLLEQRESYRGLSLGGVRLRVWRNACSCQCPFEEETNRLKPCACLTCLFAHMYEYRLCYV